MDKLFKIIKTIVNIISYVVIIAIILFLIFILMFKIIYKENAPRFFNYYVLEVVSGSMEPKINVGSFIVVKKQDKYEVGDVIAYQYDNYIITHRITDIDGDKIITKGDANNSNDDPITKDVVMGKYMFTSPFLGFLIRLRFVILILIVLFYIIWKLIEYLIYKDV